MERFVVIDASPLIGLALVDGLRWLSQLFETVYLPETVKQEVLPGTSAPGETEIAQAIQAGWINVWPTPIFHPFDEDLDAGETDCIRLCLTYPDRALLIMDERAGRAVAKEQGLRFTGTAAVIGLAKRQGLIESAREVFEVLLQSDFRISAEVIRQVLGSVGEL